MNRTITDTTLSLVEDMVNDPTKPRSLREFHAANLADLRRRAERQRRTPNPGFLKFIERITRP